MLIVLYFWCKFIYCSFFSFYHFSSILRVLELLSPVVLSSQVLESKVHNSAFPWLLYHFPRSTKRYHGLPLPLFSNTFPESFFLQKLTILGLLIGMSALLPSPPIQLTLRQRGGLSYFSNNLIIGFSFLFQNSLTPFLGSIKLPLSYADPNSILFISEAICQS